MKKSIFCFGLALIAFSNISSAANSLVASEKTNSTFYAPKNTPLCIAIQKGEIDMVKKLIEYGADVNEKSSGMTPLMVAARYNKAEIIKFLLANGAHSDTKDEKGFTALRYAELSLASEALLILKQV